MRICHCERSEATPHALEIASAGSQPRNDKRRGLLRLEADLAVTNMGIASGARHPRNDNVRSPRCRFFEICLTFMPAKGPRKLSNIRLVKKAELELPADTLRALYFGMLKPRLIEEKMLLLLRQGRISKWFSGIGQEAISVGVSMALRPDEYILPLIRNLGVFTCRELPLARLFAQFAGKASGFTKGRDRSFHFGATQYHIVGMISHLGPQLCVADGIALAEKLQKTNKLVATFCGDGGTSEGDFHEALNVAAVWNLPVIFVVENNAYALSTPTSEQYACARLSDKALGYGMQGLSIDGNDVLEVYRTVQQKALEIRADPQPVLIECNTFRMRGHEEASGTKYVPKHLFEEWAKKDPVETFRVRLLDAGLLSEKEDLQTRESMLQEIDSALEEVFAEPTIQPDTQLELSDVYAPNVSKPTAAKSSKSSEKRFVDAISDGLRLALERDPELVLMGQDVAEYGGVFKVSEGFAKQFGKERIRNTPLCESAIIGAALGLSVRGISSVVEMQFADFVSCGFNQIANNLAKVHYRWGQNAGVVIRMPTGGGSAAGPFHSQSDEAWFTHIPGLKVVFPATPYDAKGLLLSAIEDPNPVMYFEHKALYRSIKEQIPDDYYTIEIGKARIAKQGDQITIITYGAGVHWALEAQNKHPELSLLILDLRTLLPLDYESIKETVRQTGRVIILHEATLTGGLGGEISAFIAEHCFADLDAPIVRCGSLDTPVPFAAELEQNFFPKARFEQALVNLAAF